MGRLTDTEFRAEIRRLAGLVGDLRRLLLEQREHLGTKCLFVLNAAGKPAARVEADERGCGRIVLLNDRGEVALLLGADDNGAGLVAVARPDGRPVASIEVSGSGGGVVRMIDGAGQTARLTVESLAGGEE